MPRKKAPKARTSILETLIGDMQGIATQKLVLFEKLKAAGGFVNASVAELRKVENIPQALAAKGNVP